MKALNSDFIIIGLATLILSLLSTVQPAPQLPTRCQAGICGINSSPLDPSGETAPADAEYLR